MGLQDSTTTVGINLVIPQKIGPEDPVIPLVSMYAKDSAPYNKDMFLYVHSSFLYNRQELGTIEMSLIRGKDSENVVHLHNVVLLSY